MFIIVHKSIITEGSLFYLFYVTYVLSHNKFVFYRLLYHPQMKISHFKVIVTRRSDYLTIEEAHKCCYEGRYKYLKKKQSPRTQKFRDLPQGARGRRLVMVFA
ncbi:hypothetical protein CL176_00830 [Suicoccus acidiformans]|uniref:Uncharacterized protein n=1 Tax=Suicoccus acidiformans TaxID=2036206 RepID=A0A347WHY1_9LACT|nr:hypothetical protein CL176_00830 [Suicoccus acidiformans]